MIRRLRPGDEELQLELARRFTRRMPTREQARAFLADERHWLLAAVDEGAPVGVALAYHMQRWDGASQVFFYDLEVAQEARRRGHGRALVEELKRLAAASGAAKMWVTTDEANEPAKRLYAASGATAAGRDAIFTWSLDATRSS